MLSRLSIAMKVFGLAVLLLCLTVALACFLLWHVTRLQGEMNLIVQREVPLALMGGEHGQRFCRATFNERAGGDGLLPFFKDDDGRAFAEYQSGAIR